MCRSWVPAPARPRALPAPEPDPTLRIGDHERDQVSSELRAQFAAGRIGMDEFCDRLDEALRAATAGELAQSVRDLPPLPGYVRPWDAPASVPEWHGPRRSRSLALGAAHAHLRTFMTVMGILIVVWALTGFGYFWPVWPLVFWGFFAFRHAWWAHQRERRRLDWS